MMYASEMRCFKATVSPEESDMAVNPNKSTCIFLYYDGAFKVLGTPYKSYKVCSLLRGTTHCSHMYSAIVASRISLDESGPEKKG